MRGRWRVLLLTMVGAILVWKVSILVAEDEPSEPAETASPTTADTEEPAEETAEEESLPKVEDVPLPSYEELLSGPRRDWIILLNDRLIVVEPVYPRPNALQKIQAERDAILSDNRRRFSPEGRVRLAELNEISIFLPGDESSVEYKIRRTEIREILHHEDLMLRRAGILIEEGKTREAFELILVVARRDPAWPGLQERQTQLAIADAGRLLSEEDAERALPLIASLYELSPVPDDADRLLGSAAMILLDAALETRDYRQARFELSRIRQINLRHPAIQSETDRLVSLARTLRDDAEVASRSGDHAIAAEKIEQAARAWPRLDGLRPIHARLTERYQRLIVGVPRLASSTPLALPTIADDRVARLTHGDLFEIDGFESLPIYRSIYFERWEPTDLGRQARFQLRPSLPAWAARPPLMASDLVELLEKRFRSGTVAYDARFADSVESLSALSPFTFGTRFQRIPLRTEAILTRSRMATYSVGNEPEGIFQRFRDAERTAERAVYRRAHQKEGSENFLAEVVEQSYPNYEEAIQALDRGEVRMLTDVPAWDFPRLREDKRFVITQLAVPATHLLQFHPGSELSRNSELRRALVAAVDPKSLLQTVNGRGGSETGRLVTAPFPSSHLGYDPLIEPRRLDLPLALALALAAEKSLGGSLPELTFAAPAESPMRQVAEVIATNWKRIGLPVRLVTFGELGPSDRWDIAYRQVTILDPIRELGPLITLDAVVEMTSLENLPEWLRQRLLDLERASDTATAQSILIDLHRLLNADVRIVPLFETDQFVVSRGVIRGLPERPVAVYQHVERWALPHEYPEETP